MHYNEDGLSTPRNHIDFAMLIAVLTLMLLSLGVVYSASASYAMAKYGESERMLTSHAVKVLLGMLGLFIGSRIDYHKLQGLTKFGVLAPVQQHRFSAVGVREVCASVSPVHVDRREGRSDPEFQKRIYSHDDLDRSCHIPCDA